MKKVVLATLLLSIILCLTISCTNDIEKETGNLCILSFKIDNKTDSSFLPSNITYLVNYYKADNPSEKVGAAKGTANINIKNLKPGDYLYEVEIFSEKQALSLQGPKNPVTVTAKQTTFVKEAKVTIANQHNNLYKYFWAKPDGSMGIRSGIKASTAEEVKNVLSNYIQNGKLKLKPMYDDILASVYTDEDLKDKKELKTVYYMGFDIIEDIDITEIEFPDSVTLLAVDSFNGLKHLKVLDLQSSNIKTLGARSFKDCTSLEKVILPKDVTVIADELFEGCTSLKTVSGIEKIKHIRSMSFADCKALVISEIKFDTIGPSAFKGCTALTNTTIDCPSIGNNAFQNCTGLTNITILSDNRYISDNLFNGCSNMISVNIPENVEDIGYYAFKGTKISYIYISSNVEYIGFHAFNVDTNLTVDYQGTKTPSDWDISWYDRLKDNVTVNFNVENK